jgi:CobQ-like glutamine amidotransferase family enzyme
MFHTHDSMNTNIINTYTHAHSPLTVLPSPNDAFIATAIRTEYQRSFNTQTLNYSHVTQTRQNIR